MEGDVDMNMRPTEGGSLEEKPKSSSVGPVVGTIIIIALIVLGGLYFWGKKLAEAPTDEQTQELQDVSTSDALADIEADLSATELDDLDAELDELDAELDAS